MWDSKRVEVVEQSIYEKAVNRSFSFLKQVTNYRDALVRSIEIPGFGSLVPLCIGMAKNDDLISSMTRWRNENVSAYPTQFTATLDSTRAWFKNGLIEKNGRILFLIVTDSGKAIGHIGFNSCINPEQSFEIDNVVRGDTSAPKGIMSAALTALLSWARTTLPVSKFLLRVMEDNEHAIDFYRKNEFKEERRVPLKRQTSDGVTEYIDVASASDADKFFLLMTFAPESTAGEKMILTAGPSISQRESAYALDAASMGWNSQWNKYLSSFEKEFAEYVGAKYAISTSSCTGALQISLMALGIGPGDEVIVPDQTWVASAAAINYVGATPIFADVELDSWNMDARSLESLITNKTKAVVVVHMYGGPARMDGIVEIARKYGLKIVEDAAPAIGTKWQGKCAGTFGDFGAYSFQGAKLLVTGEGGMLVTDSLDLFEKAKKIADQGRNPRRTFWIDDKGVKFKMSNIQAAVGLGQIQRADELIAMKRRVFGWYKERLGDEPTLTLNEEIAGGRSIYWMSSMLLTDLATVERDELITELRKRNVDSRPAFPAISQYPIWAVAQAPKPNAKLIGDRAINLPSGVCLTRDDVMYVCDQVIDILRRD